MSYKLQALHFLRDQGEPLSTHIVNSLGIFGNIAIPQNVNIFTKCEQNDYLKFEEIKKSMVSNAL